VPKAWAKKDDPDWHSLIAHSADVAAVLRGLLNETILSNRFGALGGFVGPVAVGTSLSATGSTVVGFVILGLPGFALIGLASTFRWRSFQGDNCQLPGVLFDRG